MILILIMILIPQECSRPSLPQKTEHKTPLPDHICLKTLPHQQKLHTWSHFKE